MIKDYEDFKKFILSLTTIDLNAYKEKQMKRRIDTLIARHKYDGYDSYCKAIKEDTGLREEFVNYITINVSEFYRNPNLWKTLEDVILPDLISKFGPRLKVWSAACSTGDEPYSLAMVLAKKVPMRDIKIIATDLDEQVLEKAKDGVYGENSIKGLPKEFLRKSLYAVFTINTIFSLLKNLFIKICRNNLNIPHRYFLCKHHSK